jgi:hypothetical protein
MGCVRRLGSKRTGARECGLRGSRIAIEIDVHDVVYSRDHIIENTCCPHVMIPPMSRFHDLPSGDCFTFFHTNSVCVYPCAGVDEAGFENVSTSSVTAVTSRF